MILRSPTFFSVRLISALGANCPAQRWRFMSTEPPACETLSSASSASPLALGILYVALRIGLGFSAFCQVAGAS